MALDLIVIPAVTALPKYDDVTKIGGVGIMFVSEILVVLHFCIALKNLKV